MRRWLKRSLIAAAVLGLLLVLTGGGLFLWARASLPMLDGEVRPAGLAAPAEIERDARGVVTIRAESEPGAFFALGYAHAQDRLAQMDLMRRSGAGRLSEVIGEATFDLDRFMRSLGLYRLAEASLEFLAPDTRAALEAYADGVNAIIADESLTLPPEFLLLGYRPEPWRPADSLVWGRLMALQLSSNWNDELLRLGLAAELSAEQIDFLWPDYPADAPVTLAELAQGFDGGRLVRLANLLPWGLAPKDASNSWVVAGDRSESGKPLLANDPHLGLSAPGTWYLTRIVLPERSLAGVTAPGVPFLVLGHNGEIAWGFTTTGSDTQDLFVEQLSAEDPNRYLVPDGDAAFEDRLETVAIKGEAPREITLRATRHGPVIVSFDTEDALPVPSDRVLALAWPALRADDRTSEALYRINRAGDWDQFMAATELFHSPQQNIVYADRGGAIGFTAPARVPLRKNGDGRFPQAGWSGEHDWQGLVPFAELPRIGPLSAGRIVAANNKIVPDGYPHLLTKDWDTPFRARRIHQGLDAVDKTSMDHSAGLQHDTLSLAAQELVPRMLALLAARPGASADDRELAGARDLLASWDHVMDRERPEPLIFYAWLNRLNRMIFQDELGAAFESFVLPDPLLLLRVFAEGRAWCDDVSSEAGESCEDLAGEALGKALEELAEPYGSDWRDWRWGAAHKFAYSHRFWRQVPLIGSWLQADLAVDGGNFTVNRAAVGFAGSPKTAFVDRHGAGFRALYDLANLENSRFIIAGGQSGHPLSPFYGNLLEDWRDGLYIKLVGPENEARHRLVLLPR